jgi:hypothetical protein
MKGKHSMKQLLIILSLSFVCSVASAQDTVESLRAEIKELKAQQRKESQLQKLKAIRDCLKTGKAAEVCQPKQQRKQEVKELQV